MSRRNLQSKGPPTLTLVHDTVFVNLKASHTSITALHQESSEAPEPDGMLPTERRLYRSVTLQPDRCSLLRAISACGAAGYLQLHFVIIFSGEQPQEAYRATFFSRSHPLHSQFRRWNDSLMVRFLQTIMTSAHNHSKTLFRIDPRIK